MSYLISHILICLIIALVLGFLLGWLWSRARSRDEIQRSDELWRKRKDAVKKERDDLQAKTRSLSDSLSENEEDRSRLRRELRETKQQATTDVEALREQLTSARQDLTARDQTVTELRDQLAEAERKLAADSDQLSQLEDDLAASKAALEQRDKADDAGKVTEKAHAELEAKTRDLRESLAAKEADYRRSQQELQDAVQQATNLDEELDTLRKEMAAKRQTAAEVETLREQLAHARHELAERDQTTAALRDQLAKAEREQATHADQRTQLEQALAKSEAALEQQEQAEEAAGLPDQPHDRRLEEQLNRAEAALTARESELAACRERGEKLATEIATLRRQVATTQPSDGLPVWVMRQPPERIDDLTRIKGVGPVLNKMLNELGIYQFAQITAFAEVDVAWVSENLTSFKDRIVRDDWVSQAQQFERERRESKP